MVDNKLRENWEKIKASYGRFKEKSEIPEILSTIFHLKDFKRNLITGIATVVPLLITLYVFFFLIETFGGSLAGVLQIFPPLRRIPKFFLTIISLGVVTFAIYTVGALTGHWAGESIVEQIERLFLKIPLVKTIYVPAKELTQALVSEKKISFRRVALIEFPAPNSFALGFVTSEFSSNGKKFYNVFVPTTPNPTSGWYLILPEEKVKILEIGPEAALKIIVSGGIVFSNEYAEKMSKKIEEIKEIKNKGTPQEMPHYGGR